MTGDLIDKHVSRGNVLSRGVAKVGPLAIAPNPRIK